MFPDYVLVVYVIISELYGNPLRVCCVFVNSQSTDVALFLPSRRVHQRFGSYVMNIQAPQLCTLTVTRSLVSRRIEMTSQPAFTYHTTVVLVTSLQ